MKLWSILGNSQKLDGGAMFGNAPRALWSRWSAPDEANRIALACRALLASPLNGKTVLFETGIGAFFEPKLRERYGVVEDRHVLLESLHAAGFEHDDVDVVVLSHLHFDHAGGLLAPWSEGRAPELLFRERAKDEAQHRRHQRHIQHPHAPPDGAHQKENRDVQQRPIQAVGADRRQHEDGAEEQRSWHQHHLGPQGRKRQVQHQQHYVADVEAGDERPHQIGPRREQQRPGLQPVLLEGGEEHGRRR